MKKNVLLLGIIVVIFVVSLFAIIFGKSSEDSNGNSSQTEHNHDHEHDHGGTQEVQYTLKLALSAGEDEIHYEAAEAFAAQVEVKTKGAVCVEIYGNNELGGDEAVLNSLSQGAKNVDIVISEVTNFDSFDKRMDISTLPFIFASYDEAWNFLDGEIQGEVEESLLGKNMRVLAYYSNGFDCLTTKSKVISKASDIRNMKFAVRENDYTSIALRSMNANVMVPENGDFYSLLQQDYCDGCVTNLEEAYERGLYYAQDCLFVTYHRYEALAFVISDKVWESLDEEYRTAIEEAAIASAYTDRHAMKQKDQEYLTQMQNANMRVYYTDADSFKTAVEPFLRGISSEYGDLVEKILNR